MRLGVEENLSGRKYYVTLQRVLCRIVGRLMLKYLIAFAARLFI